MPCDTYYSEPTLISLYIQIRKVKKSVISIRWLCTLIDSLVEGGDYYYISRSIRWRVEKEGITLCHYYRILLILGSIRWRVQELRIIL